MGNIVLNIEYGICLAYSLVVRQSCRPQTVRCKVKYIRVKLVNHISTCPRCEVQNNHVVGNAHLCSHVYKVTKKDIVFYHTAWNNSGGYWALCPQAVFHKTLEREAHAMTKSQPVKLVCAACSQEYIASDLARYTLLILNNKPACSLACNIALKQVSDHLN